MTQILDVNSFKSHIARLLCLLIIFLISSNVVHSFEVYIDSSAKDSTSLISIQHDHTGQAIANDEVDQLFNLVKDPQEIDFDLFLEDCAFVAVIIKAFLYFESKSYFTYNEPILNLAPLWIRNLQIRL